MISFDIKQGYHHIPIHPLCHSFLGFACEDHTGVTRYFRFVVLPFGLTSATYIFTKIFRQFIKAWRAQGLHTVVYIDDGIDAEPSFEEAAQTSATIQKDLVLSGWVPHATKSVWVPTRITPWLGNIWDLVAFTVYASEECL